MIVRDVEKLWLSKILGMTYNLKRRKYFLRRRQRRRFARCRRTKFVDVFFYGSATIYNYNSDKKSHTPTAVPIFLLNSTIDSQDETEKYGGKSYMRSVCQKRGELCCGDIWIRMKFMYRCTGLYLDQMGIKDVKNRGREDSLTDLDVNQGRPEFELQAGRGASLWEWGRH